MYTGIEVIWLGFIASIKADNGWKKQKNIKDYIWYLAEVWKVIFP